MNRLIFLAILTCNCGEASTPTPLSLSFALLTLFVFTKYSLPLTSAAQWYFKSRLIKSFGLRDIYVCICMIFFCTEHFFLFSLSIFTTVVHLCMPQEPIRNWKCGNENVRKKTLKYILTLTHSVGLCFWLYDGALESLITQLRKKTQHSNLRWRSFGLEFKFRFPLCMPFSRDFPSLLRAGMALSLALWTVQK